MSAPEELLGRLHAKLADKFLAALEDPDCSPQLLNAASKFLKDNGIECIPDDADRVRSAMEKLAPDGNILPFNPAEEA